VPGRLTSPSISTDHGLVFNVCALRAGSALSVPNSIKIVVAAGILVSVAFSEGVAPASLEIWARQNDQLARPATAPSSPGPERHAMPRAAMPTPASPPANCFRISRRRAYTPGSVSSLEGIQGRPRCAVVGHGVSWLWQWSAGSPASYVDLAQVQHACQRGGAAKKKRGDLCHLACWVPKGAG